MRTELITIATDTTPLGWDLEILASGRELPHQKSRLQTSISKMETASDAYALTEG